MRNYVDRIELGGKVGYVRETIVGEGAPTDTLIGFIGQRYVDTTAMHEYICAGVELLSGKQRYIWNLKKWPSEAQKTVEMTLTFEDGTVETLQVYVA